MNGDVTLTALRTRITAVFPAQIRAAVEPLSDEQLWWRPNESSNSIGNLILHLSGSLDYFLNRNFGGLDFTRDRAREFAEREHLPKAQLLARFEEMVAYAKRTFEQLHASVLDAPSPEPSMHSFAVEDLINVYGHLATHAGQIIWIAKMLKEGAYDDVWMRAHRAEGAWKRKDA